MNGNRKAREHRQDVMEHPGLRHALRLRRKLLVPVMVALTIVAMATFGIWGWHAALGNRARTFALAAQVDRVQAERTLADAWQRRDREPLLAAAMPLFQELAASAHITHFYFIDTNSVCWLRVHQPERWGDAIDRVTMRNAAASEPDSSGLEVGPLGTFTLRYVRPWRVGGVIVGYIELGKEVENLARALVGNVPCDLITVMRKDATTRANFESGRRALGFSGEWDAFERFVVLNQTVATLPTGIAGVLRAAGGHRVAALRGARRRWMCRALPVEDAAGRHVVDLLVMRDVTRDWPRAWTATSRSRSNRMIWCA